MAAVCFRNYIFKIYFKSHLAAYMYKIINTLNFAYIQVVNTILESPTHLNIVVNDSKSQ